MRELLGLAPSAPGISHYIESLSHMVKSTSAINPEVKSYPDAVYFNYYPLGVSLLFIPRNGYKPGSRVRLGELQQENLLLDSIDIYNVPKTDADDGENSKSSRSELSFSTYPVSPIILPIACQLKETDGNATERPSKIEVTSDSSGKDFVGAFGEPNRKGGGTGPSSGSINIWCEWSKDGVMVEFGGVHAKGPHAWDTGKDAVWKVITVFSPGLKRD